MFQGDTSISSAETAPHKDLRYYRRFEEPHDKHDRYPLVASHQSCERDHGGTSYLKQRPALGGEAHGKEPTPREDTRPYVIKQP